MVNLLDKTDWEILLEYDRNPFQSYHSISKKIGIHHSTVKDRINGMKDNDILQKDRIVPDQARNGISRLETEVVGVYSPSRIGLRRIHVLFKRIKSVEDYNLLYKFCDYHPYTHYFVRLFGHGITIYAQFDIPPSTLKLHKNTFIALKDEYIKFEELEIFPDKFEIRTNPNYEKARKLTKDGSNYNIIQKSWNRFMENYEEKELVEPQQEETFDNIDAELIREITINAKVKITDLTSYYGKTKSTLSRRLTKIRENYVTRSRLVFGRNADKILGFNNTQIITGKFFEDSSPNPVNFSSFLLSREDFPFEAFIATEGERFFLYNHASVGISGDLIHFLYKNTDINELNQYQFYISNALSYPFYHGNYDESKGYRTDTLWIKDDPLSFLESNV